MKKSILFKSFKIKPGNNIIVAPVGIALPQTESIISQCNTWRRNTHLNSFVLLNQTYIDTSNIYKSIVLLPRKLESRTYSIGYEY